jgi:hypothetical protein
MKDQISPETANIVDWCLIILLLIVLLGGGLSDRL